MEFEIDVSGHDILNKDYTIVVAEKNNHNSDPIIFGYKFSDDIVKVLKSKYGAGLYRYKKSEKQISTFRVKLYSISAYFIIKHIYEKYKNLSKNISLALCKDFDGRENEIKSMLNYHLANKIGLNIEKIYFERLPKESLADKYAYLMRKDKKNLMKDNYINITITQFEEFLK